MTEYFQNGERWAARLSPLPVRERMKVRVLLQRVSRDSGFCLFYLWFHTSKALVDRLHNLLHTLKHLAIPESKHSISLRLEKRRTNTIFARPIQMLRPIQLDDKPPLSRAKIRKIGPNRMLPSELRAAQLPFSQKPPQYSFGIGLLAPQPPRVILGRFDDSHNVTVCQDRIKSKIRKEQNLESRAKNARWNRTLTFILSLTGRGDRL